MNAPSRLLPGVGRGRFPAGASAATSPSSAAATASRVLLVGPCPPPHGGISVHVDMARRLLADAGVEARVLNVHAPRSRPVRARRALAPLAADVRRAARDGWAMHLHTNGHNRGSWLLALACGLAAGRAPLRVLTLHSGMAPAHLARAAAHRWLARLVLGAYDRVVCVNPEIRAAVAALGVPAGRLVMAPAYLGTPAPLAGVPGDLRDFLAAHTPVLVATSCYRPEYGLDVLIDAMRGLLPALPQLGCLLLGSGEGEAAVRRALVEAGLEDCVRLTGDLPHELALEVMARADVFVRPTHADGDSLSVREALALGVPVVASDASPRPAGVTVCRRGDAGALAAAIAGVLAAPLGPRAADRPTSLAELLGAYALPSRPLAVPR